MKNTKTSIWQTTFITRFKEADTLTRETAFFTKEAAVEFLNKSKEQLLSKGCSNVELSVVESIDTQSRFGLIDTKTGTMYFGIVEEKPIFTKAMDAML